MNHTPFTHEHPRLYVALRTRTRTLGTLNIAVALSGRSCGWGTCDRPRRTFIGKHRHNRRQGRHFLEVHVVRGNDDVSRRRFYFHRPAPSARTCTDEAKERGGSDE